ncbi:MAG: SRPBCC family protein [Actinomycetota bacterium]
MASAGEYVFIDKWHVDAPPEAVFDALADATTYPEWWRPVYIDTTTDGPPEVGRTSQQHFKGRLPYHLHTRSTITRYERPTIVGADVEGDLRGRGLWTLAPRDGGTDVRFDWRVYAEKPIVRALTPVLRPLFRWNHAWAIARAQEGLEPYARRHAA